MDDCGASGGGAALCDFALTSALHPLFNWGVLFLPGAPIVTQFVSQDVCSSHASLIDALIRAGSLNNFAFCFRRQASNFHFLKHVLV